MALYITCKYISSPYPPGQQCDKRDCTSHPSLQVNNLTCNMQQRLCVSPQSASQSRTLWSAVCTLSIADSTFTNWSIVVSLILFLIVFFLLFCIFLLHDYNLCFNCSTCYTFRITILYDLGVVIQMWISRQELNVVDTFIWCCALGTTFVSLTLMHWSIWIPLACNSGNSDRGIWQTILKLFTTH